MTPSVDVVDKLVGFVFHPVGGVFISVDATLGHAVGARGVKTAFNVVKTALDHIHPLFHGFGGFFRIRRRLQFVVVIVAAGGETGQAHGDNGDGQGFFNSVFHDRSKDLRVFHQRQRLRALNVPEAEE